MVASETVDSIHTDHVFAPWLAEYRAEGTGACLAHGNSGLEYFFPESDRHAGMLSTASKSGKWLWAAVL
ncbi:hypothetical protein ACFRAQ_07880 [Nocardia sp. NPDC056611]|uniref:hypothetical protein n=1 Tax=Nocardia sp. NPDC056611 TaxID=3345877 RepID=UPI00366E756C